MELFGVTYNIFVDWRRVQIPWSTIRERYSKPSKADGRFVSIEREDGTVFAKLKDIILCKNRNKLYAGAAEYMVTTSSVEE